MLPKKIHSLYHLPLGIFLISVILAAPATANVSIITHGKSLMTSCQQAITVLDKGSDTLASGDHNDAFLCMAYLSSMFATAQHANELAKLRYALATEGQGNQKSFNLYCFDWQLSYEKMAHIVLGFGQKQPHYLQQPAHELAIRALQTAFPCR